MAVLLSARGDGHSRQVTDAEAAVQAVAVLLCHLAATLPITLGSSEVFNETCQGELFQGRVVAHNEFAECHYL